MMTFEHGRNNTWRLPRFSALFMHLSASAKTFIRTIVSETIKMKMKIENAFNQRQQGVVTVFLFTSNECVTTGKDMANTSMFWYCTKIRCFYIDLFRFSRIRYEFLEHTKITLNRVANFSLNIWTKFHSPNVRMCFKQCLARFSCHST